MMLRCTEGVKPARQMHINELGSGYCNCGYCCTSRALWDQFHANCLLLAATCLSCCAPNPIMPALLQSQAAA
jgi:hypothetical protein